MHCATWIAAAMAEKYDAEAIRASVNLAEYAARFFEVKRAGKEFRALCFAHADSNPSLTIYQKNDVWAYKCFSCGEAGDVFDFYAAMHSLDVKRDFLAILKALSNGSDGVAIPAAPLKRPPPRITVKPPLGMDAPSFIRRDGKEPTSVHAYLDASSEVLGYAAYYDD